MMAMYAFLLGYGLRSRLYVGIGVLLQPSSAAFRDVVDPASGERRRR